MDAAKVFVLLVATGMMSAVFSSDATADITELNFAKKHEGASAESLFGQKKYEEAQEAFAKLAEAAGSDVEEAKWQARRVIALGMQDGKYEKALAEAKSFEKKPYALYARIQLMFKKGEYKAIINNFQNESINEWPDYTVSWSTNYPTTPQDIKVFAYRARGNAYLETGKDEQGRADLTAAIDLFNARKKGDHFTKLGMLGTLNRNLDDEDKSFEVSMRVVREIKHLGGKAQFMSHVLKAARYLRKEGKLDEALDVLSKGHLHNRNDFGTWGRSGRFAYGRIYAAKAKAKIAEAQELEQADKKEQADEAREQAQKYVDKAMEQFQPLVENLDGKAAEQARKEVEELTEMRAE